MIMSACTTPAGSGDRRIGEADLVGQGVQPPPLNWLAPQRDQFRSGGARLRGEATAKQPAPAGVRGLGGEAPAPSEARLPPSDSRKARVRREAAQVRASSPEPKAKPTGARSEPGGAASDGGSRAPRGAPRACQRQALEAEGREGAVREAGVASSHASTGAAALAASPKGCPGRCLAVGASLRLSVTDRAAHWIGRQASALSYRRQSERQRNNHGRQSA